MKPYKKSYIKQIDEIYARNKDVTHKQIQEVLKCDLNHVRMRLEKLRYEDAKNVFKTYNIAPPPTREDRHTDSNRWHDIEADIKDINVDLIYEDYEKRT